MHTSTSATFRRVCSKRKLNRVVDSVFVLKPYAAYARLTGSKCVPVFFFLFTY